MTITGFALPAVAYFAFVAHFGVNVIIFDQWTDVGLIGKAFSGHLDMGNLWAQHNQNRMLFPNLVVLALAYSTHLNVRIEEYLSAVLLSASVVLIIGTHRRRAPTTPMIWYCPVAIVMFSWVQYENTLWGFQLAWYVVLVCLAGTLFLLDRDQMTLFGLSIAIAVAIVGSYSSVQGLLIWPAGLLLMLYRRHSWKLLVGWATAAVVITATYFYHLNSSQFPQYQINPLLHPFFALKLLLFSLGNVAGKPLAIPLFPVSTQRHLILGTANPWIVVFGTVLLVAAVFAVIRTGLSRARERPEPLGVSLILFALGFDVLTVIGRGLHGYAGVSASRYTTYNVLALVGAYLVIISRPTPKRDDAGYRPAAYTVRTPGSGHLRKASAVAIRAFALVIGACVVIQAVGGYANGFSGGREDHSVESQAISILRAYPSNHDETRVLSSNHLTKYDIVTGFSTQLIPVAQRDKLSLFDTR